MHNFLSSIGFSNIRTRQMLEPVYREILRSPSKKLISPIGADTRIIQINKDFGDSFGISLVGEMSIDGSVSIEYYFPYAKSKLLTDEENVYIEGHSDKRSYAGVSENYSLGMTLIFFVTNVADYEQSQWLNKPNKYISRTYFSALSTKGTIILDVDRTHDTANTVTNVKRNKLIEAAKKGDQSAIESLTLEDMDTYNLIGKRTRKEDVLTIVESSFMPVGIETDHYAVIGMITACHEETNAFTQEEICMMDIKCNDLTFTLAINRKALLGEPAPGRRFKGDVWLQGHILLN